MSESQKGKHHLFETKKKIGDWQRGRKHSVETRKKISIALQGEKAPNWQGGISKTNMIIRSSVEYKLWRESVFRRDNYTCVFCGLKGIKLNADHIKPFFLYPELRFAIDNGRSLCEACHRSTDTFAGRAKNYKS